jgi:hypothetical protein
VISNNALTHISDTASYANAATSAPRGPLAPLHYEVGVQGESVVDGWNAYLNTLTAWQAAIDWGTTPAAQRTATADPDGNGWNNLLEFFSNTSPTAANTNPGPVLSRQSNGQLTLAYRERTSGLHSLSVEPQQSSDLTSWQPIPNIVSKTHDVEAQLTTLTFTASPAMKFYRLRITEPTQ